jgi:hypothetical protein
MTVTVWDQDRRESHSTIALRLSATRGWELLRSFFVFASDTHPYFHSRIDCVLVNR